MAKDATLSRRVVMTTRNYISGFWSFIVPECVAVFVVFYQYNQQITDELTAKYEAIEAERLHVR